MRPLESRVRLLLASAGIEVNGTHPWDITVHNPAFYARVVRHASLGLGESYMDDWWDCPALDQFFVRILSAGLDRAARRHYDAGNDLFQAMLDRRMLYTSGLWENAADLDQAQEAKLDFICRRLALQPGMSVLDIGCGWGGFARFAAERYRVRVDGITLSREQLALGQSLSGGLPVELRLQDYRDLGARRYDRLVSLGMFEHVGSKNYARYFASARRLLAPGGLFFLSTIGSNHTVRTTDPWIERYIFPNSHLPSIAQIGNAIEDHFIPLEWHNWAGHYDRTLMAWHANFARGWEGWQARYGRRFCRMWRYYLLSCAAAFRARSLQDWQILLLPVAS